MNAPMVARILGLLFLVAGIAGFVPWIAPAAPLDAPVITLDGLYRFIFGIFPANVTTDIVHVFLGACGLIAAARFGTAAAYCRFITWFCLILTVLGALPVFATYTLFGAAPIYGWDVLFHFVFTLLAAYGGYGRGSYEPEPTPQ
jgi:hypothetical protein